MSRWCWMRSTGANGSAGAADFSRATRMGRSAVEDGGAANRGGAGARPFGEILGKFAVPRTRRFGHRALGGHPLLDCAPAVITLVRFHFSLRSETNRPSPADG